jgi:hypothetical protein
MTTLSDYINNDVIDKLNYLSSHAIDIALLDDNQPYFIEINTYGKEYAAGS